MTKWKTQEMEVESYSSRDEGMTVSDNCVKYSESIDGGRERNQACLKLLAIERTAKGNNSFLVSSLHRSCVQGSRQQQVSD